MRHKWTPEHIASLRRLYPDFTADVVAKVIGCATSSVHRKAAALGLRKSEAFKESDASGRLKRGQANPGMQATQFKPGHKTWNAGLKGWQAGGRSVQTQFKPGRKPQEAKNYRPIGSRRVTKDGLLEEKITDDRTIVTSRRWTPVHRLVWEAANGPVPAGHLVVFRRGMKTAVFEEITVDRLECITRAENAIRNTLAFKDPELFKLIQLKGAITRQVNRIAREAKEKVRHEHTPY